MSEHDVLEVIREHHDGARERLISAAHAEPENFQYVRGMVAGLTALQDEVEGWLRMKDEHRRMKRRLRELKKEGAA